MQEKRKTNILTSRGWERKQKEQPQNVFLNYSKVLSAEDSNGAANEGGEDPHSSPGGGELVQAPNFNYEHI